MDLVPCNQELTFLRYIKVLHLTSLEIHYAVQANTFFYLLGKI